MGKTILKCFFVLPFFSFFWACSGSEPRIDSIDPRIGLMGEVITIYGENFGDRRGDSHVTIGGSSPTNSSYVEWSDSRICFKAPEFGDAGLVYVWRGSKKSNAALFSNRAVIPQRPRETGGGRFPRILGLSPPEAAVGALVTITGENFGMAREGGRVYFSFREEGYAEPDGPQVIEVSGLDFGYEYWGDGEIRVRVPDGAVSGNLQVKTAAGASLPLYFEVLSPLGSKDFRDKRSYSISYSVDVKIEEASNPNSLYLWMPVPVTSPTQKTVELLSRSAEPFIEKEGSPALFQLNNTEGGYTERITLSYLVDVYELRTNYKPGAAPRRRTPAALENAYTAASPLMPKDDPEIRAQALRIVGREQNPYSQARIIYYWIIDNKLKNTSDGDAYSASLLFCTLARALKIPALPVAGVLVDRSRASVQHYWAEFWADDLGWVPVDPWLGSGRLEAIAGPRAERQAYYFGSLDNQRIAFSRGEAGAVRMDSRGRVVAREKSYALQEIWEEAAGGLESYSSLWSGINITGIYAN
jgi:transglutaminase-like putative cysteine protease